MYFLLLIKVKLEKSLYLGHDISKLDQAATTKSSR